MSHPELSSGGGSSLSSGKLSKLLVSVGDATCGKKRVTRRGQSSKRTSADVSSWSHNPDRSRAFTANCSQQEKFCIQQLFAESQEDFPQPPYANDPGPLRSLVQEQLSHPLVQGRQKSLGPPQSPRFPFYGSKILNWRPWAGPLRPSSFLTSTAQPTEPTRETHFPRMKVKYVSFLEIMSFKIYRS